MTVDIIDKDHFDDDSTELFSLLQVPWTDTREQAWESLSGRLKSPVIIQMRPKIKSWQIAMAASLILLISIGTFMRTFTVKLTTVPSQHLSTRLPDGSKIILNAGTDISYKPYWWWKKRIVTLQGEAYFDVLTGKSFSVESDMGVTEVLGTSFNIYSRNRRFEVVCETGKVRVQVSATKSSVILNPREKASLLNTGQLQVEEDVNMENTKAWISNQLVFTSEPLVDVFTEIERQYSVEIHLPDNLYFTYTGSFEKKESVEKVLRSICRPFELQVHKADNNQFYISK